MLDLHRLSIVLKHANSDPPMMAQGRADFYRLKEAILRTYGTLESKLDIQHIRKECWSCNNGIYRDWDETYDGEVCRRCNGTRVFSESWVRLERWNLAGKIFHRPIGPTIDRNATIEGIIRHRPSKLAFASQRVLYLVCAPQYFQYLDLFQLPESSVKRVKGVLAYLLGFSRDRWRGVALKWSDVPAKSAIPIEEASCT